MAASEVAAALRLDLWHAGSQLRVASLLRSQLVTQRRKLHRRDGACRLRPGCHLLQPRIVHRHGLHL